MATDAPDRSVAAGAPSTVASDIARRDPFPPGLQKLAAASGILFVAFLIASIATGDAPTPDYGAPAAEYEQYAREHADGLKVGLLFALFAAFSLVWFSGMLRSALADAEEAARGFSRIAHVASIGAVIAAVGFVLSSAMRAAAANEPTDAGGAVIRGMIHISDSTGALITLGFALMLIAAGLVMARTDAFPRWLGVLGLVTGLIYVGLFFYALTIDESDTPLDFLWPLAMLGLLVWTIATSVTLIRRVGRHHRSSTR